jgi:hypothetical protein
VKLLNGLFGLRAVQELNEREPARPAGVAVDGQHDVRRRRHRPEIRTKIGFSGRVR